MSLVSLSRPRSVWLWLILSAVVVPTAFVRSRLQAAVILPHGDFAYDPFVLPSGSKARSAAQQVALAARSAGEWLSHFIEPEILVVSTPHGIQLTKDFAIYNGQTARGSTWIGKDLQSNNEILNSYTDDYKQRWPYQIHLGPILLETNMSQEIVDKLTAPSNLIQYNVSGVSVTIDDDSEDMPLHWGEIIPLSFISSSASPRKHVIVSHPQRRYKEAPLMVDELMELGAWFRDYLDSRPENIAIIVSADLSHTHQDQPYFYSNSSAVMDRLLGQWASDPCRNAPLLLKKARSLQLDALVCGFTGFVWLHGILCPRSQSKKPPLSNWKSQVLANRNATYYGMIVATYERDQTIEMDYARR